MATAKKKGSGRKAAPGKRSLPAGQKPGILPTGNTEGYTAYSARPPETIQTAGQQKQDESLDSRETSVYEQNDHEKFMSLGDHLEELRIRLLWIIGVLAVSSIAAGVFIEKIHGFLVSPYLEVASRVAIAQGSPGADKLILGSVYAAFQIYFQLALMIGGLVSLPIALSLLWGFVTPAVSKRIARIGHVAVGASTLLFWGGVAFAWIFLFPLSLNMMLDTFLPEGVIAQTSIEKYYSFLYMIVLGSGLTFQLPMIVVVLGLIGIVPVSYHRRVWKIVIISILAFSGFVTPPDPFSLFALAGPLTLLYGISVGIVWLVERGRRLRSKDISAADH